MMKLIRFIHRKKVFQGYIKDKRIFLSDTKGGRSIYHVEDVQLIAPVVPSKIICVGLNYKDHAAEMNMDIPVEPVIFMKPPTAVIGPGERIIYPDASQRVDYEAELAVVMRRKCKNVPAGKALDYVLGYTCFNDVTARDLQAKDGQWTRAKSFDTFACIGPWVETELETKDLYVRARLNRELKQDSSTKNFIFTVPEIVSFVSKVMTLLPGDVISTGTPGGIGPMAKGDHIEVEIEGIGSLVNYVR
jgi:2-keto-4-pentenoate hydratase/2-oxohepta-3-ene-1,7-dioic acid hydratase in catechol pathway